MAAIRAAGVVGDALRLDEFGCLILGEVVDHDRAAQAGRRLQFRHPPPEQREFGLQCRDVLHTLVVVGRQDSAIAVLHALEDGFHRVIVQLRNGIKLVVMAAGAADGEAEQGRARGAHHVVQFVGPLVGREHRIGRTDLVLRPAHDEARGGVGAQLVAAELLLQKGVVGLVGIERFDHPVAIRPGVGPGPVHLEAVALGEPHDVEPVPRPAFAVVRRREQPIDEFTVGSVNAAGRAAGILECGDLFRRGRQSREVERHPADERARVGLGTHGEAGGGEFFGEEGVDRGGARRRGRHRRPHERLKRPVVLPFEWLRLALRQQLSERLHVVGPDGAGRDPLLQERLLIGGERLAVGGHPRFLVVGRDANEEFALLRLAGHDARGAGVAPGDRLVPIVDPKATLGRVGPVAGPALASQKGCHLVAKNRSLRPRRRPRSLGGIAGNGANHQQRRDQAAPPTDSSCLAKEVIHKKKYRLRPAAHRQ